MGSSTPGKRWHTREDSGLRLDRELRWWHDGEPIEHPKVVKAFNAGLAPTGDGRFKLTFGTDWCYVEVEDAAYAVLAVDMARDHLRLHLSDGTTERLDAATLELDVEGVLRCQVKAGLARARFGRDAQFALGSLLEEENGQLFLRLPEAHVPVLRGSKPRQ